jgi:AH receptor-interacting protein
MGKKKDPSKKTKTGHMCGMMAMQMDGGLGYDDLNELLKDPQELEFIIELLNVELPDEYKKESWQMDPDEKLTSVPELKDEGNRMYGQKQYKDAADKYGDAIGRLEQLMLRYTCNH